MPYVDANGVHTYYEEHGAGQPLLLLHGGGGTIDDFAPQVEPFARDYRVILPERRAHGRTQDVDGPITYDVMTEDTIAFMELLGLQNAAVAGWSDGGNIGLLLAIARPDLVRKLVCIGANFTADGLTPRFIEYARVMMPETYPAPYREAYQRLSPDGSEHFAVVLEKVKRMWLNEPSLTHEDLAKVGAPTLLMVGDRDLIRIEHTVELYQSLPKAQLAILPGATHDLLHEKPDLANRLMLEFFATS